MHATPAPGTLEIAIFPLRTLLYPEGVLPLQGLRTALPGHDEGVHSR